jgi:hypothetical protein
MEEAGVVACATAECALTSADFALSLVTADSALPAARDYAGLLKPGAIWCDMNSVAPDTKRAARQAIEAAGGAMSTWRCWRRSTPRMNVPLLLAGEAAADAEALLREAGFANVRIVGTRSAGRARSR